MLNLSYSSTVVLNLQYYLFIVVNKLNYTKSLYIRYSFKNRIISIADWRHKLLSCNLRWLRNTALQGYWESSSCCHVFGGVHETKGQNAVATASGCHITQPQISFSFKKSYKFIKEHPLITFKRQCGIIHFCLHSLAF